MGKFDFLFENSGEKKPEKKEEKKAAPVAAGDAGATAESGGKIKFPTKEEEAPTIGATNCEPHMDAVMKLYEKGFEGLDQPGVEFFEYFKSVASAGMDNPAAYTMAFNMLKGLEPDLSKDGLLEQSKFYVTEIEKVHQGYDTNGKNKKIEVEDQKNVETEKLKSDISLLEQQLETTKNQIEAKKLKLGGIDSKYDPEIEEIGCKMAANDMARDKILGAINKVVEGIKANIQ